MQSEPDWPNPFAIMLLCTLVLLVFPVIYQVSSFQSDIQCDAIRPSLLFSLLPRQASRGYYLQLYTGPDFIWPTRHDIVWTYLLYGVSFPMVMGIRAASFSSALTQILSPHGPLLNSTTCWTLGGTATATRQVPPELTGEINTDVNADPAPLKRQGD